MSHLTDTNQNMYLVIRSWQKNQAYQFLLQNFDLPLKYTGYIQLDMIYLVLEPICLFSRVVRLTGGSWVVHPELGLTIFSQ